MDSTRFAAAMAEHANSVLDAWTAQRWVAGRDDIGILSIDEGFAVARDIAAALTRYEPGATR